MTRATRAFFCACIASVALGAACPKKESAKIPQPPSSDPPGASESRPPSRFEKTAGGGAHLTVLFTASVEGYIEPCGCTAEPLGGIARYAAAVEEAKRVRGEENVLVLDAGNLFFERADDNLPADACQALARHEILLETYRDSGLLLTVLGKNDNARGAEYSRDLLAKYGIDRLSMTPEKSGNKKERASDASSTRMIERAGHRIGIIAYSDVDEENASKTPDEIAKRLDAGSQALRSEGATLVIALMQLPPKLAQDIGRKTPNIDVMIQGRAPGEQPQAPVSLGKNGPLWVSSGMQAQYLGVLEIGFGPDGASGEFAVDDRAGAAQRRAKLLQARMKQWEKRLAESDDASQKKFLASKVDAAQRELEQTQKRPPMMEGRHLAVRSIELDRQSPEQSAAKTKLDRYEKSIPDLVAKCEADVVCEQPKPGEATFVGVEACYQCHQAAVKFWRQQKVERKVRAKDGTVTLQTAGHSKAWETLEREGKTKDRTCIGCHSIGFNLPGGYCKASEVDFRKNVQCEACHGAGSLHLAGAGAPKLINGHPGEETCRSCHHVPHIPTTESFVFEDMRKLILGPGHGMPGSINGAQD